MHFLQRGCEKFHRRLLRKHNREKEVMAFSSLPSFDKKMIDMLIGILRKRGNFMKMSDNIMSPVRRPCGGSSELYFKVCIHIAKDFITRNT